MKAIYNGIEYDILEVYQISMDISEPYQNMLVLSNDNGCNFIEVQENEVEVTERTVVLF